MTQEPTHTSNSLSRGQQHNLKQAFSATIFVLIFLGMAVSGFSLWACSQPSERNHPDNPNLPEHSALAEQNHNHPDNLNLPEYSEPAAQICLQAKARIAALPTDWDIDNPLDLAAQVKAVNLILEPMLDQLRQLATRTDVTTAASQEDQRILNLWLDDWKTYIDDRIDLTISLLRGQEDAFTHTTREGRRITDIIKRFAEVNNMPACQPPTDI